MLQTMARMPWLLGAVFGFMDGPLLDVRVFLTKQHGLPLLFAGGDKCAFWVADVSSLCRGAFPERVCQPRKLGQWEFGFQDTNEYGSF